MSASKAYKVIFTVVIMFDDILIMYSHHWTVFNFHQRHVCQVNIIDTLPSSHEGTTVFLNSHW